MPFKGNDASPNLSKSIQIHLALSSCCRFETIFQVKQSKPKHHNMNTPISSENKIINKVLRKTFNGLPKYSRLADDNEKSFIDVLSCANYPVPGTTSYGTLGLSDHPVDEVDNTPLGVEFTGCCYSEFDGFINIVATSAFYVINSKYECKPGSILNGVVSMYISSPMKHIMLVTPFTWEKSLETLYLKPKKIVAWLQLIPISDEEMAYATVNENGALEKILESEQIDIFDISRKSVI